ncbi:MAG: PQQ-binding-like beta-propeller repeat protein, partial [Acidimicrobiales bacterium]
MLDSPITSETVDRLELAWSYEAAGGGTFGSFTTTPLVIDDTVYIGDLTTASEPSTETGEERFVAGDDAAIFGPTGVGAGYGRLYGTKADDDGRGAVVVAYDATDGEELWATDVGGNGSDVNVQPVVYDGLVIASTSGYGGGSRATIYALDAETGAIVWDFPVVEDDGLWGNPQLNSGGGVWYPPTIDTERGLAYFGTGNPYPFPGATGFPNGSSRPGDNRWTDSIVALDLDSGELAWGHQLIAHDIFDRDAMITGRVDVEVDGEERSLAISTGKLGLVTALDADTGEEVWQTSVGTHDNDELTEIDGPTLVYPGSLGGVQTPIAIADGTIYACVMNAPTQYEGPEETSYGFTVQLGTADSQLVAIDAATGDIEWDVPLDGDAFGGATVSGDLVFTSTFGG